MSHAQRIESPVLDGHGRVPTRSDALHTDTPTAPESADGPCTIPFPTAGESEPSNECAVDLVAESGVMRSVADQARRFANSSATVLLCGESGTGKEVFARLIHQSGPRAQQRYVRVNCAALSESLIESELFGHQRGAFTGAAAEREGRFEWADGGTLLLDEISEIPLGIQAKLLRVLEEEEVQRVGTNESRAIDVRVIATSNRDLQQEVRDGRFRMDLYHRINVLEISLPPLRQRSEEIPILVGRFIESFGAESKPAVTGISFAAMRLLQDCDWPGNVRQLRNVIHRACVVAESDTIQPQDLPTMLSRGGTSVPDQFLNMRLDEIERCVILKSLQQFNGNKTATAEQLGVTARTLSNKMKQYREQGLI